MKGSDASRRVPCMLAAVIITICEANTFALAAGDAAEGARTFRVCLACHSTKAGEHLTGPSLANIWQRKAGTVAGFRRYSDAIKQVDVVWSGDALDKWLTSPARLIPGTSMTFQGLHESKDRQDVIAYLKAVSAGNARSVEPRDNDMMMNMRPSKEDLTKAPPPGRVTAISHCGDTYTVKTADGKTSKVWEFNLRLKTDSSGLGPPPGKPVIIGAGMQGDRASVIFAAPREISRFISERCDD